MASLGGRPTKLTDELIEQGWDYFDGDEPGYVQDGDPLPTVEGLALWLNIGRTAVYEWAKGDDDLHTRFANMLESLQATQARMLISNSLIGKYQPTITKLLLNKHGYTEQSEVKHSGEINRNASEEELDAIIERANSRKTSASDKTKQNS